MSTRRSKRSSGASDPPPPPPPALDTPDARLERLKNTLDAEKNRILAAAAAEMEKEEQDRLDEAKRRVAADKDKRRLVAEKQENLEEERLADAKRVQHDVSRLTEVARSWTAGGGGISTKDESRDVEALKEEEEEEEERVVVHGDHDESASRGVSRTSKQRKTKVKQKNTPLVCEDIAKDDPNTVVHAAPALYPSCLECMKSGVECRWKNSVITARMTQTPSKLKSCECCKNKQKQCKLEWEKRRPFERGANKSASSSHPSTQEVPSLFMDILTSIDNRLGVLVKHAADQTIKTTLEHEAISMGLAMIQQELAKISVN